MPSRPHTAHTPVVELHCPACRAARRCLAVGTVSLAGRRREVVQCGEKSCGLTWVPQRTHLVSTTPRAA